MNVGAGAPARAADHANGLTPFHGVASSYEQLTFMTIESF